MLTRCTITDVICPVILKYQREVPACNTSVLLFNVLFIMRTLHSDWEQG